MIPLPTLILPGYFARATDYQPLEKHLNQQGIPTVTIPLRKRDWIPTLGGRSVNPIIRRIDQTIQEVLAQYQANQVNLIGHSAGGWIGRIYLGEHPYNIHGDVRDSEGIWRAHRWVSKLITLGTPHTSQERWTKRNLDFVNETYPGAFYPHVTYVCVAGKAVYGQRWGKNWLAYQSYQLTCGTGDTWGDGITPIKAAHLDGAINLTLDGVMHSPHSPEKWYGSAEVISSWIDYLVENSRLPV